MQAASVPKGGLGRSASAKQLTRQFGKEVDRLMQPVGKRRCGELRNPAHERPCRGLLEALASRAAGEPKTQKVPRIRNAAISLDRTGLAGQLVEVEFGRQTRQDVEPAGVGRCQILHLRYESYSPASREEFSSKMP